MRLSMRGYVGGLASALVVVSGAVTGSGGLSAAAEPEPPAQPNIVVVLLDDARYDDFTALRRLREFRDSGATFESFYSSFPLCCPARATLLSGQYPHNHGVLNNVQPTGGFAEFKDKSTLATWLDPDYRTGLVGKYFNQYSPPYTPPGWNEWMVPRGTYHFTNAGWYLNRGLGGAYTTIPGYQTATMGTLASNFIKRNAPRTQPFFLWTAIVASHAGNPVDPDDPSGFPTPYVDPKYRDARKGQTNTDPSFNEADVSDKPIRPAPLTTTEVAGLTETLQQRRESMLSAKDALARIEAAVAASGEAENTYVVVTSDNGYLMGEHRLRGGKVAPYQVSNRMPLLVRGPGITPGTVITETTAQVDVAPTLAALAGVPIDPAAPIVDGENLAPLLHDPVGSTHLSRPGVIIEATDTKATSDPLPWLYNGIVSDGWKYIERANGRKELYNLSADPYELVNVAGKPRAASKQAELAASLADDKWCAGADCR